MRNSRNTLLVDTGYLVALFSERDRYHEKALQLRHQIEHRLWFTTWPVLTETCHLLGTAKILALCERNLLRIFDLRSEHFRKIQDLMIKYGDLPMDLADASLVILAEELGSGEIVSTDFRDFKTYKFKNHAPFRNLLSPIL